MVDTLSHITQLKTLSVEDLEKIASHVREMIIQTVSETGGHLASSLGVVELTIAMLSAFEPPKDKIIWDVGHQCYAYKILTDRYNRFETLRKDGGISGFPSTFESEYDAFGVGHASTSLSAALGVAKARDLMGDDHRVVAVIGDGALSGGMAWEAINNASIAGTDLTVILNDNEMSISPSIGAVSGYINQLRSGALYQNVVEETKNIAEKIAFGGILLQKAGQALHRGVTQCLSPRSGTLFEALGFTYLGPVDGHDMALLRDLFHKAKHLKGPVLIHAITTKGKGYKYAENDATAYHGVGSFDVVNGKQESSNCTSFSDLFGRTLVELAEQDSSITAITAAMPDGTGLTEFASRFPNRFFNVGIAESHAATFAAGLATGGMKPVVALYSTFLQRAYDQIVHDICLQNLPVVFAIDRAGIVGQDGPTHQGVFDIAFLRHIPNLMLMAPRNGNELRSMLKLAFEANQPCAIRYPRDGEVGEISDEITDIEPGSWENLKDGKDVAFLAVGNTVDRCLEAAGLLENDGYSVGVVNCRFIKPMDAEMLLRLAEQTRVLVTVEEHVGQAGFGSAVMETMKEKGLSTDCVFSIALPDQFIPHGSAKRLRDAYGLSAEAIAEKAAGYLHGQTIPFEGRTGIAKRKDEHISICLTEDVEPSGVSTGLEHYRFVHNALPEIDRNDISLDCSFLGKQLKMPLMISPITGGTERALQINKLLATAAQEFGIALSVGSQRISLRDPDTIPTFRVRKWAPDVLLCANLGAVQLNNGLSIDDCRRVVEMIDADVLTLHLNAIHECAQPGGDTDFSCLLPKIEAICGALSVPVMVKEVGCGISTDCAKRLLNAGVKAIDVAGTGGTSWPLIESYRANTPGEAEVGRALAEWGIPTAESICAVRAAAENMPLVASGGIRTGLDIAKCIALGADVAGIALPFLKAAEESYGTLSELLKSIADSLTSAMLGAGCADLCALRSSELLVHSCPHCERVKESV